MCWSHVSRLLPLFLLLCFWSSAFGQDGITNPVEVKALRAIKESLNDPVQRLRNWRRGDPCNSNWTGVLCWNSTLDDGYLHVRELQLLRMNLSGTLSPDLGRLTRLTILDFMWNNITGSIPKEIGNIKSLELLLLNGNRLSGNLPEELGYLPNLDRIQIDENRISGPLPKSFGNLTKTKHFHMNNNSISGQIPPELGSLPSIVHILLDNNNLSGFLPPELANMPNLLILQLDNNHFDGATIPPSYGNMSKLLKLSLRNCSLQGPMPDLSTIPTLGYLDLSRNQLNGSIPTGKLSDNITTIDLSNNSFTGTIPTNFSGLPRLQKLSVANNALSGSIPSSIYQDRVLNSTETLTVDLRNNRFSNITGRSDPRPNVTVWLQGNPLCSNGNLLQLCGSLTEQDINQGPTSPNTTCSICPPPYELSPEPLRECFCAAPLLVGYRLKSPGFSDFIPYVSEFQEYLTSGLSLDQHQLLIDSFQWQKGPRLRMYLKFFPLYGSNDNNSFIFNRSEVRQEQTSGGQSYKADIESMSESLHQGVLQRRIPSPGDGKKIYDIDPMLKSYDGHLDYRYGQYRKLRDQIDKNEGGLEAFSRGYEIFGFTRSATGITYREWAPGAKAASLIGDFNNWNSKADVMTRNEYGVWEIFLPNNADGSPAIPHGSRVKIRMDTPSGIKDSIPAWIKYSVQAPGEIPYNGVYYDPAEEDKYVFKHPRPRKPTSLRIYESHVGMSSTEPMINTYANFRDDVLPRIKKLGYNAVQIMAIQEHSYYASFGYHVTNFFAPSSRFGTPDDLKSLIDKAHELGLVVLMDIVHSHASKNTLDGLNMFDGTDGQYFHSGERGYHWMWDSRLFNYGSWEVLRYLLSNARWWLEEYKFDGFRFDGVTSMMYTHHGLQVEFTGNYNEYFGYSTDVDAVVYLMLVNDMIHGLYPEAIVVGEDVSGMPAFCIPVQDGGVGFDYRLHMAVADKWIELLKKRDEDWQVGDIVFTLTNRRWGEKCVVYAESHDQALVGDKTIAFWLMDKDMYDFMAVDKQATPRVDRGIALHKMIRLITMGLGGEGYLNFMGNEFGHPEWIDFPRTDQHLPDGRVIPGNNASYDKCRRRFDLGDAEYLRYHGLQEFDRAMQHLEEKYGFMTSEHQYISRKDEGDRVIVFERGNLVFVFNFHWTNSYSDYRIGCSVPGKYKIVLDSDGSLFGGFSRLDDSAEFFTSDGRYDDRPCSLMVYAPCRTAVVYAAVDGNDESSLVPIGLVPEDV